MLWQDANQVCTWWRIGKTPDPERIYTAGWDYWLRWITATPSAA